MYVPGKLKNTDKVLVDVGTGFYVEKVCAMLLHNHCTTYSVCVLSKIASG